MSDLHTLLLIASDSALAESLTTALRDEGYLIGHAADSIAGMREARTSDSNLIILDADLPEIDGVTLCGIIRKHSSVPIILLTNSTNELQQISGLDKGADLCMVKPVSAAEMHARVRSLLRRGSDPVVRPQQFSVGDLRVDTAQRRVWLGAQELRLTLKEFDLLACLMRHRGVVLSRGQLLREVWGARASDSEQTLEVHICWLRQKIERDPRRPRYIQTVRMIGYRFDEP
jgi:two-component system, OmpR family, response regulator